MSEEVQLRSRDLRIENNVSDEPLSKVGKKNENKRNCEENINYEKGMNSCLYSRSYMEEDKAVNRKFHAKTVDWKVSSKNIKSICKQPFITQTYNL